MSELTMETVYDSAQPEPNEKPLTEDQLKLVRDAFFAIKSIDPDGSEHASLVDFVKKCDTDQLASWARLDVRWLSAMARQEYLRRTGTKLVNGRAYKIVAKFEYAKYHAPDSAVAAVNQYTMMYPNTGVILDIPGHAVFLARLDDQGVLLE